MENVDITEPFTLQYEESSAAIIPVPGSNSLLVKALVPQGNKEVIDTIAEIDLETGSVNHFPGMHLHTSATDPLHYVWKYLIHVAKVIKDEEYEVFHSFDKDVILNTKVLPGNILTEQRESA